jgi:hypothetical protein
VLQDLEAKLSKFQILANDSSADWKSRMHQAWRKVRWDQSEIANHRSRIVSNVSLLNLIIGDANKYVHNLPLRASIWFVDLL